MARWEYLEVRWSSEPYGSVLIYGENLQRMENDISLQLKSHYPRARYKLNVLDTFVAILLQPRTEKNERGFTVSLDNDTTPYPNQLARKLINYLGSQGWEAISALDHQLMYEDQDDKEQIRIRTTTVWFKRNY